MRIYQCIKEPRGQHGLEGYSLNSTYKAEEAQSKLGEYYYRVWPDYEGNPSYYETCSVSIFRKFFKYVGRMEIEP